ncbi:hypothetical protein BAQU_0677 [Bifidobacterium aquikefiri]|uniref:Uncharacterized protein n=1 Tax=Bifidobacterium aquikefiri TaxID=1653207 RepID=A0A261G8R8_9BIFI|nr:hypothetical protein BAQU_0677 [Bifidobacterium aquikefiri]
MCPAGDTVLVLVLRMQCGLGNEVTVRFHPSSQAHYSLRHLERSVAESRDLTRSGCQQLRSLGYGYASARDGRRGLAGEDSACVGRRRKRSGGQEKERPWRQERCSEEHTVFTIAVYLMQIRLSLKWVIFLSVKGHS